MTQPTSLGRDSSSLTESSNLCQNILSDEELTSSKGEEGRREEQPQMEHSWRQSIESTSLGCPALSWNDLNHEACGPILSLPFKTKQTLRQKE